MYAQSVSQEEDSGITITYVGNEGVLIEVEGKKVLIDGLHRRYKPAYQHLSEEQLTEAEKGVPPFDDIDVILVTHIHNDHFHPVSIGKYLINNDKTILIGACQVRDSLQKQFSDFEDIAARVMVVTPDDGIIEPIKVEGINVKVFRLTHTNQKFHWIQNLGFIVTLNDTSVLHIGDAAMLVDFFRPYNLDRRKIDVAALPYWFFIYASGQEIIRNHMDTDHLIGLHIDPRKAKEQAKRMKQAFPHAKPFIELFDEYKISNQKY